MRRHRPGERWYRQLLQLYPREFREEFGGEMSRLYRDRRRDEPWSSLWASLLLDLVRTAPAEHLAILRQDLRHACRGMSRTPLITATAILTLALGVGAGTAVFSLVHAVLLRPLPYAEPNRIVELFEINLKDGSSMRASALNYLSWAEHAKSFDAIAAFGSTARTLTDDGDPELLGASYVTASFFHVLRVAPITGRALEPDDEQLAAPRVVVLSEPVWRRRFGGDRTIVGRSITLDGERHQVVGVMPRAFREVGRAQAAGTAGADIFLPLAIDRARENRANHTLRVVARLQRSVSIDQARDEMRAVAAALEREFPATNSSWSAGIETLTNTMFEPDARRSLLVLLAAVTMVFLIACANVANLMLARGTRRQGELAVRAALGAGRSRLVRQLLTESSCLAIVSGIAGIVAAAATHPLLRRLIPATLPRIDEMRLDANVLAFGLLLSMTSGIVFGIVPALRSSRFEVSHSLMLTGRATTDPSRARLRRLLIVGQMAVATMLLIGAALLLQGFVRLQSVPLGFEPDHVWAVRLSLPRNAYPDAQRTGQFYDRLVNTLESSGQVQEVAVATSAPFAPGVRVGFRQNAAEHIVNGDYFRVLGIPLLAGRSFTERDTIGTTRVAMVSQRFARGAWPDADPLGQLVERGGQSFEVVGIVGDIRGSDVQGARGGGPDREPRAAIYLAATQLPQGTMTLLLRTNAEAATVTANVRQAVRQLDPSLPVQQARPLREWLADSVAPARLTTVLAAVFAMSALLLASIGIYGVLAYSVASRTREIGLRMAIGATRERVIGLVLREGLMCAGSGIAAGLIGALGAARVIASLLFEVPARDPLTFATAGGAVLLVALGASAIPALRAVRIDPTVAMRTE